jgi:hypothetical protein
LSCFRKIKVLAERETGIKMKVFRSGRGGEFNSAASTEFCTEQGLRRHTTAGYSPQQNGVVERRNQTVVEMARCMMKSKGVPAELWAEAVKVAVHVLNRSPTRALQGVTPYEKWHKKKPNVSYLRVFGCVTHVKVVGPGVKKLDDRSVPMVFVGYEDGAKAYRLYNPATKRLHISRDVLFEEERQWDWSEYGEEKEECREFTVIYNDDEIHVPQLSPGPVPESRSRTPTSCNSEPGHHSHEQGQNSGLDEDVPDLGGEQEPVVTQTQGHPMQTRAKSGIVQPNPRYADEDYDYSGLSLGEDCDVNSHCLLTAEEPSSLEAALEDQA